MTLTFLVPGALDQLTGGYLYDRQVVDGLRRLGRTVHVVELPGQYPAADTTAQAAAAQALAALPDGHTAVIDGLALPAFEGSLAGQARRLRLVGFIHHPLSQETGLTPAQARHYAALEARLWPLLRGAVCPSAHTARALLAAGLSDDRVAVVKPGTTPPAPRLTRDPHGPLQLLSVGTVTPRKGHRLLITALAGLQGVDWHLSCIGSLTRDPAAAAALRSAIEAHGLSHRVTLRGEQPAATLTAAYQAADVFVLPSYFEGYGMAHAEALAQGLPVVASTGGALPDTVPADASLLVPPGDAAALRDALRRLLSDAPLRQRLSAGAARAAAALPDWDHTVRNWATALEWISA
jgi:glycosyltransferase involved in cell wall biosynthesis